jgi:hypothetical protein
MPANTRAGLVFLVCLLIIQIPSFGAGHPNKSDHPIKSDSKKSDPKYSDQPRSAVRTAPEVVKLHFPDKSLGALLLVLSLKGDDHWGPYQSGTQVGSAKGNVTVTVPADCALMMDANRRVFENPIVLKEVSPGLGALRMSFMSMEDREDHMVERAMPYVENLKSIRILFFDRSEVTDSEICKVKNLPHLNYINLFLSQINGACFSHLSTFPELYQLDCPCCHIEQKYIASLAQIRKLKYLDLGRTDMNIVGARSLAKLTGLTRLSLSQNFRIDDECMKCLQPLKKLTWLDVRSTSVTFEGLKALSGIKLRYLFFPPRCLKHMQELKVMFPSAILAPDPGPVTLSKDDKMIYAPLK